MLGLRTRAMGCLRMMFVESGAIGVNGMVLDGMIDEWVGM